MPLPRFLATFLRTRLVAPAPVIAPIAPLPLAATQPGQLQLDCPAALSTLRQLLDQDMLRWLDRQPTYLSQPLLKQIDALVPVYTGPLVLNLEQWVALSHALVTYQILQQQLGNVPLLAGAEPRLILTHLAHLRSLPRQPLP